MFLISYGIQGDFPITFEQAACVRNTVWCRAESPLPLLVFSSPSAPSFVVVESESRKQ